MTKKYNFVLIIGFLIWITSNIPYAQTMPYFPTPPQTEEIDEAEVRVFELQHPTACQWGKLVTVFDQPSAQRLTFESDTAITIVELSIKWSIQKKQNIPSIRQITLIKKTPFTPHVPTENPKDPTPDSPNKKNQVKT